MPENVIIEEEYGGDFHGRRRKAARWFCPSLSSLGSWRWHGEEAPYLGGGEEGEGRKWMRGSMAIPRPAPIGD